MQRIQKLFACAKGLVYSEGGRSNTQLALLIKVQYRRLSTRVAHSYSFQRRGNNVYAGSSKPEQGLTTMASHAPDCSSVSQPGACEADFTGHPL